MGCSETEALLTTVSRAPAGAMPISRSGRLRPRGTASCSRPPISGPAPEQLTGLGVTELGTDVPGLLQWDQGWGEGRRTGGA